VQINCISFSVEDKLLKTVLIVDDSEFMRTLIKKKISDLDINVIGEAGDGKEALEKYIEIKPDIVTLDLAMQEHGGLEALGEIIKIDPDAKVIIVCSTAGQGGIVEEAEALGAFAIVKKPLKDDELVEVFKKLL